MSLTKSSAHNNKPDSITVMTGGSPAIFIFQGNYGDAPVINLRQENRPRTTGAGSAWQPRRSPQKGTSSSASTHGESASSASQNKEWIEIVDTEDEVLLKACVPVGPGLLGDASL
ncbi:hypothetical protein K474DRAFT_1669394, partial [Panus rudis PR-1116 ss-1]